jgi:hypothetical protein
MPSPMLGNSGPPAKVHTLASVALGLAFVFTSAATCQKMNPSAANAKIRFLCHA